MALPAIPVVVGDILESVALMKETDQIGVNVRHWRVTAVAGGAADLQKMCDSLSAILSPLYRAMLAQTTVFQAVGLRRISPGTPTVQVLSSQGAGIGDLLSQVLPRQTAGVITLQSVFGGRSGRGRMYVPFPAEEDNETDGTPTVAYVTRLTNLAAVHVGVQAWGLVGGVTVSVQSIIKGGGIPPSTVDVVNARANDSWGTQRRRGSYGPK